MSKTEWVRPLCKTALWNLGSGIFRIDSRSVGVSLFCAVIVALTFSFPASASDAEAIAKIAPRLASEVAFGGSSEALIVFTEQADLSAADNLPTKLEKGQYVYNALRAVAERTQAPLRKMLQERGIPFQAFYGVNMIKVNASRDLIYEIAAHDEVERIEDNPQVQSSIPQPILNQPGLFNPLNQTPHGVEWNVARVNAPQVWALGFRGQGIVVANADTGVQWNHIALKSHYRGWNGRTVDHNYNWHDATRAHSPTPIDPKFHGTFTMSEMVGDDGRRATRSAWRPVRNGSPAATWINTASARRRSTSSALIS